MLLTPKLRTYLARLDKYRIDLDLPGYEDSKNEEHDLKELDLLWDALEPGDRSHSDYNLHCSEYLNPLEASIIKMDLDETWTDPRRKLHMKTQQSKQRS